MGIDIPNLVDYIHDDVKKQKEVDKSYDSYLNIIKKIEEVKVALSRLSKDRTIIFVVDEIDRCLPEYAIKVLERLHHVFSDVANLQVILSVDKTQLDTTVHTIFGKGTEVNGYLKKFISFAIELNVGETDEDFIHEVAPDYYSLFQSIWSTTKKEDVVQFIKNLLAPYDMRTRLGIVEKSKCLHSMLYKSGSPAELSYLCAELLMVVCQKEKLLDAEKIRNVENTPLNTFLSTETRWTFFNEKILEKMPRSETYKHFVEGRDLGKGKMCSIQCVDLWSILWILVCGFYEGNMQSTLRIDLGYGKTDLTFLEELFIYSKDFYHFCCIIK